jgi:predicted amidophosphoribosyltransferase
LAALAALLAPPDCPACGVETADVRLCGLCAETLERATLEDRQAVFRLGLGPSWPALEVRTWAAYEGFVRTLIHRFKFGGESRLAIPLGSLLAQRIDEDLTEFDVLCSVPTHLRRVVKRGVNPGSLLARSIAPVGTVPVRCLLTRKPGPAPQSRLTLEQREEAPFGLFAPRPASLKFLRGARVLLVDDVCTSGATLSASAQALYEGGADWVVGLVVARAMPRTDCIASTKDATDKTCL